MKKSLIALAFGTLGLGIAEFVMMGILPNVARDLQISIPTAGHFYFRLCIGGLCRCPRINIGPEVSIKTYIAGISHPDYDR